MTYTERPMSDPQARSYWNMRARDGGAGDLKAPELASTVTNQVGVARLRDRLEMAHFERILELRPHFRVLDLAGGAGRVSLRLAPRAAHVTILDLAESQLAVARASAAAAGLTNLAFVHASVTDGDAYGGPYDLILLFGACLYLDDAGLEQVAQHCARALAPGGRLILKEPVSTTGVAIDQHEEGEGLAYRSRFRPRAELCAALQRHLRLRYQSVTCAHPIPWFLGGTEQAADASESLLAHPGLEPLRSLYVSLDPALRRLEASLRGLPLTRSLLAPTPVVQDFMVFDKLAAASGSAVVELSIVVIAFNEEACLEATIGELLGTLAQAPFTFEIIVVNDGSSDRTAEISDRLCRGDARLRAEHLASNRGIGAALRAGFDAARGQHVTWLPADGQIPPEVVRKLYALRDTAPMLTTVYRTRADPFYRKLISKTLNAAIFAKTGQVAKSGGNYLFERAMWQRFAPAADDSMMLSTAFRASLRTANVAIEEVEIDCRARTAGHSKVLNPRAIWRTFAALMGMRRQG